MSEPTTEPLVRAWGDFTIRFANPDDPIRRSDMPIREAFAAGWDEGIAEGRLQEREAGLDVERLARAMARAQAVRNPEAAEVVMAWTGFAERIAAEYALDQRDREAGRD